MTETKTYCDHCGMELSTVHAYYDSEVETPNKYFEVDLCRDCVEHLNTIIRDFLDRSGIDDE